MQSRKQTHRNIRHKNWLLCSNLTAQTLSIAVSFFNIAPSIPFSLCSYHSPLFLLFTAEVLHKYRFIY